MPAADLVEHAIEAHGGLERFRSANELVARVRAGGLAFTTHFKGRALAGGIEGHVSTREPRSVLVGYPKPGQRGIFEPDRVRIESGSGDLLAERRNPRAAFRNFRHNFFWDQLDMLHFAGYALWNYMTTPFIFTRPGFQLSELEPWRENGERWRRLHAVFPDDIPTHSGEQDFYFDDAGLLRRLDYTAEVFGSWAKAAHYCFDHKRFDGFSVPTRRRVTRRRRNNRPAPRPILVWIEVQEVRSIPIR
jgi:hypothetical protein